MQLSQYTLITAGTVFKFPLEHKSVSTFGVHNDKASTDKHTACVVCFEANKTGRWNYLKISLPWEGKGYKFVDLSLIQCFLKIQLYYLTGGW